MRTSLLFNSKYGGIALTEPFKNLGNKQIQNVLTVYDLSNDCFTPFLGNKNDYDLIKLTQIAHTEIYS